MRIIGIDFARTKDHSGYIEMPMRKCIHMKDGACELGIKTWCSNCMKQNWGKYEPESNGKYDE